MTAPLPEGWPEHPIDRAQRLAVEHAERAEAANADALARARKAVDFVDADDEHHLGELSRRRLLNLSGA